MIKDRVDQALLNRVPDAVATGAGNLTKNQRSDGGWQFEYHGPTFLLPLYVAARHVSGPPIPAEPAARMRAQLSSVLGDDGSIGMYAGGPGWVFTSTVGYVALRLLGEDPEAAHMVRLRTWIREHGTPLRSASWGKIFLCQVGLYEYEGIHPLTPEAILLPRWAPVHPSRLWCYTRQTYLPMAWLYGRRAAVAPDGLVRKLRTELYDQPYEHIDWARYRSAVHRNDDCSPLTPEFRILSAGLQVWERIVPRWLRSRALRRLAEHLEYEDEATQFVRIGVVNGILNTLVHYFRGREELFQAGLEGVAGHYSESESTLDIRPNPSVRLWDTAFCAQALIAADEVLDGAAVREAVHETVRDAIRFIHAQQIRDDLPARERFYRDRTKGGWPLDTLAYGWPVSDCTGEALGVVFWGERQGLDDPEPAHLRDALRWLSDLQNSDGGWPTCERARSGEWLERLNPSQVFGGIMVDTSHTECTASVLEALVAARAHNPMLAAPGDLDRAVRRGRDFLLRVQRPDGGFEGNWGVCFTYGTWFGIRGLRAAGVAPTHESIQRACAYLRSVQHADGSWGESPESCRQHRYVSAGEGKATMTAWAVLALVAGGQAADPACTRGVEFLLERQHSDGTFPPEGVTGSFQHAGTLSYDGYRHYFPVWALAAWHTAVSADDRR